jgi:hypothetical protein
MRGVMRPSLLFARLVTILFFGLLIVCFVIIALLGFGALSRTLFFGVVEVSNLNWSALVPVSLRAFWGSLPYLALTVLFAVISRSPLFAAGGTILYGTVFEVFASPLSDQFPMLVRNLPIRLSQVLQTYNSMLNRTAPRIPSNAMAELHAIVTVGFIFILLSIVSLVIFSRQDLGG